ncbi:Alpha/Beta hydrolase protein [Mycena filopes]|nr:Alpha/Beta hydrolase protein [Mycena filopes]
MHVLSLTPLLTLLSTALSSPVLSPDRQTALYSSDTPFLADLSLHDAFSTPAFFFDTVSPALFDDFVRYTKYSSAAYILICRNPLGNTLVYSFSDGAHGFIARDDTRSEIILTFRGTLTPTDVLTDLIAFMVPLQSPGIPRLPGVSVHQGFLKSYNSVAADVLAAVVAEHQRFPTYTIIVTGHSLGGALASLAAPVVKSTLPNADVKLYTFGQPRVGNAEFAALVEKAMGVDNIFRVVHTNDGVPMVPRLGNPLSGRYRHFATEYWQFQDPSMDDATPHATVRKCTGGEDTECSNSFGWKRVLFGHTRYFGQNMALDLSLCPIRP